MVTIRGMEVSQGTLLESVVKGALVVEAVAASAGVVEAMNRGLVIQETSARDANISDIPTKEDMGAAAISLRFVIRDILHEVMADEGVKGRLADDVSAADDQKDNDKEGHDEAKGLAGKEEDRSCGWIEEDRYGTHNR